MKDSPISVTATVCVVLFSALVGVTAPPPCNPGSFQCDNGMCLLMAERCDGIKQCKAGDDEKNCPVDCGKNIFTCSNGRYIDLQQRCDGNFDCENNEDEMNCIIYGCTNNTFQCINSRCIGEKYMCNGIKDCRNGEDEVLCGGIRKCANNAFRCYNGQCIPISRKCDRKKDCRYGEDEMNCVCLPDGQKQEDRISCKNVTRLHKKLNDTGNNLYSNVLRARSRCQILSNAVRGTASDLGQSWNNYNRSLAKIKETVGDNLMNNTGVISSLVDSMKKHEKPSNQSIWDVRVLIQKITDAQKEQANNSNAEWLVKEAEGLKAKVLSILAGLEKRVPKTTTSTGKSLSDVIQEFETRVINNITQMVDTIKSKIPAACKVGLL